MEKLKSLQVFILIAALFGGLFLVYDSFIGETEVKMPKTEFEELTERITSLANDKLDLGNYITIETTINNCGLIDNQKDTVIRNLQTTFENKVFSSCEDFLVNKVGNKKDLLAALEIVKIYSKNQEKIADYYKKLGLNDSGVKKEVAKKRVKDLVIEKNEIKKEKRINEEAKVKGIVKEYEMKESLEAKTNYFIENILASPSQQKKLSSSELSNMAKNLHSDLSNNFPSKKEFQRFSFCCSNKEKIISFLKKNNLNTSAIEENFSNKCP